MLYRHLTILLINGLLLNWLLSVTSFLANDNISLSNVLLFVVQLHYAPTISGGWMWVGHYQYSYATAAAVLMALLLLHQRQHNANIYIVMCYADKSQVSAHRGHCIHCNWLYFILHLGSSADTFRTQHWFIWLWSISCIYNGKRTIKGCKLISFNAIAMCECICFW